MGRVRAIVVGGCVVLAQALVPSVAAGSLTIGSDLNAYAGNTGPANCGTNGVFVQTNLPGRTLLAPAPGVITEWGLRDAEAFQFKLRVIDPLMANDYAFIRSSDSGVGGLGIVPHDARLPIEAGNGIGLECSGNALYPRSGVAGAANAYIPATADGDTGTVTVTNTHDMLFNATIEPDLDNDVFGDETQDKCVGTAGPVNGCTNSFSVGQTKAGKKSVQVTASVPGAGTLKAGDANDATVAAVAAKRPRLRPVTLTLTSTSRQDATLTLKLSKGAKKKLKKKDKLKLSIKLVYTPPGGTPSSQTATVKVKRKKQK